MFESPLHNLINLPDSSFWSHVVPSRLEAGSMPFATQNWFAGFINVDILTNNLRMWIFGIGVFKEIIKVTWSHYDFQIQYDYYLYKKEKLRQRHTQREEWLQKSTWRHREKMGTYKPRKEASEETNLADIVIPDF